MCTGAEIALIAMSVAGTGANMLQQRSAQKEQERLQAQANLTQMNEMKDQRKEEQRTNDIFQENQQNTADELSADKRGELEGQTKERFSNVSSSGMDLASFVPTGTSAAPKIVQEEFGKKLGETKDFSQGQADALGRLNAFGDTLFNIGQGTARSNEDIANINSHRNRSAGIAQNQSNSLNQAAANVTPNTAFGDALLAGATIAGGIRGPENFGQTATGAVPVPVRVPGRSRNLAPGLLP